MFDLQPPTRASADDDDDFRTTNVRVDRLDNSVTADQLYAAFSHYGKVQWVRVFPGGCRWSSSSVYPYNSARVCFDRIESVDRLLADHQGSGCTIKGFLVNFRRSKPGQWLTTTTSARPINRYIIHFDTRHRDVDDVSASVTTCMVHFTWQWLWSPAPIFYRRVT